MHAIDRFILFCNDSLRSSLPRFDPYYPEAFKLLHFRYQLRRIEIQAALGET
jgi:hypothetical protein